MAISKHVQTSNNWRAFAGLVLSLVVCGIHLLLILFLTIAVLFFNN
jgi:hypothetical protein